MVIWLSVKPIRLISVKVEMMDVGMAMAAMSVERQLRMNSRTMMRGKDAAQDEVLLHGVKAASMKPDWSRA